MVPEEKGAGIGGWPLVTKMRLSIKYTYALFTTGNGDGIGLIFKDWNRRSTTCGIRAFKRNLAHAILPVASLRRRRWHDIAEYY